MSFYDYQERQKLSKRLSREALYETLKEIDDLPKGTRCTLTIGDKSITLKGRLTTELIVSIFREKIKEVLIANL